MTSKFGKFAGIDYSITSPALCVGDASSGPNDCMYFVYCDKKHAVAPNNITVFNYPDWGCPQERFDHLSNMMIENLLIYSIEHVAIEGFSYGSAGLIFDMAENAGLLKHKLWRAGIEFKIIAPSAVKKFATGRGNAKKDEMYAAWLAAGGRDIQQDFAPKSKNIGNPVSDIVDAFYIMKHTSNHVANVISK